MKFSEHWLRTLVDPPIDSDSLAHALTMAGLEVEERAKAAPASLAQREQIGRHRLATRWSCCGGAGPTATPFATTVPTTAATATRAAASARGVRIPVGRLHALHQPDFAG